MKLPIAFQLYSIRDQIEKNFEGALKSIAEIGYKGVEFYTFGNFTADQLRKLLGTLELKPVGSHTSVELLRDKLDEVLEYNQAIGNKYIVCPYNTYDSRDAYVRAAEFYNACGEKIRSAGLEFLYHNHDFEFTRYDGEYGLDIILKSAKPENLGLEADTGWVFYSGVDVAEYVKSYAGRCPLIHIKDFEAKGSRTFTELGNGVVDIKAIVSAAKEAGTEWIIVEQDESSKPTLESARISFENLKKMGLA